MKYALYPGWVTSKEDFNRHFIDARTLAALYQVPMKECVVNPTEHMCKAMNLIVLRPKFSGDYTLPKTKVN